MTGFIGLPTDQMQEKSEAEIAAMGPDFQPPPGLAEDEMPFLLGLRHVELAKTADRRLPRFGPDLLR